MTVRAALCLLLLTTALPATAADQPPSAAGWKQLKTEHFLVVGNAREAQLKDAARRLERFHNAWERLYGPVKLKVPNVVTVMKDEDALIPYKPRTRGGRTQHEYVGMFSGNVDHTQFTLAALDDPADTYVVLYNGYATMLRQQTFGPLPRWVEIGLTEFFSAFDTDSKGRGILGKIPEWRKPTLTRHLMLPLERIITADGAQRTLSDDLERPIFYAEAWGLIHYLLLNPERFQQFGTYITAVTSGTPVQQAFSAAFAMSFDEMEAKLKAYLRATMLPLATLDAAPSVDAIKSMKADPMGEADALAVMGGMSQHIGDYKAASVALKRAMELGPENVRVLTAAADLMLASGEFDDAVALASKAAKLAPGDFGAQYWLGEALLATGEPAEALVALGTASRLNKESGPALFATSMAALAMGRKAQSDATLTLARRFTADPTWSLVRARHAYGQGLFDIAAADADLYVGEVGAGGEEAAAGVLLGALARMHLKQGDAARPALSALAANQAAPWQGTIARFLLGQTGEKELLAGARNDGQLTDAHVYAGLKNAVDGRVQEAVTHLEWVKSKGRRDADSAHQQALARLELLRLKPRPAQPAAAPSTPQTAGGPATERPAA